MPANVVVGFHLCFGTLGGWPRFEPEDISGAVRIANAFIGAAKRPVGWMHIPMLARVNKSFYEPLRNLDPRGARVFLGIVHNLRVPYLRLLFQICFASRLLKA